MKEETKRIVNQFDGIIDKMSKEELTEFRNELSAQFNKKNNSIDYEKPNREYVVMGGIHYPDTPMIIPSKR